jgi:hypothetical protein
MFIARRSLSTRRSPLLKICSPHEPPRAVVSPEGPSPFAVLAARLNSHGLILLRTLCRSQNTELPCNQANPTSFAKTPGAGDTSTISSASNQQLTNSCFLSVRRGGTLRLSLLRAAKGALSFAVDLLALCFHVPTNPSSGNPFCFTSIQIPGSVGTDHSVPLWGFSLRRYSLLATHYPLASRGRIVSGVRP